MYLAVLPSGGKSWRLGYRFNGKQQTIVLGTYPATSLAEARRLRDEKKAELATGSNPMHKRKPKQSGMTFEDAVRQYWEGRQDVSAGYLQDALRATELHLLPTIGHMSIDSIERSDLLAALKLLDAAGKFVYVRKVRIWASLVFEWAIENGYSQTNPAHLIRPEKAFGRRTMKHMPALDLAEIPSFMRRLNFEKETLQSVLACKLLALTWVRTNELRFMQWSEIDGDLWRIPAGKMKRNRDHLVPLSKQALYFIETMQARNRGGPYVFEAEHRTDRPISENAVLYMLARIGYKGRMSGHGWRTVASTWANESGYNKDAIERQLAHAPDDKVRAAYNRAEFMPERRRMLQDWADWLLSF